MFQAWTRRRSTLEAREAEGDIPSANDWHASDDDAVSLMMDMAAALGFDGEASGVVELDPDDPRATVCGSCGRGWDDNVSTAWTPAPGGRCPFECDHEGEQS